MAESMREVMNPNLARERDEAFPHAPEDWSRSQAEARALDLWVEARWRNGK